jgi:GTP-binding protein
MRIFDTAGMRRRARVVDRLEKLSVADALRAVRFAEVVVILLDAQVPFETQDLRLADLVEREGRAVVVAVNKWDLVADRQAQLKALLALFDRTLPQLRGAELVTVSALTGRGLDRLQAAVVRAHAVWNRRVATSKLNRWLAGMVEAHPPPAPGGRRIKLRYITQVKTRPPGFVIKCSNAADLPDSYSRYLVNGLRESFDMPGTPIRLFLRDQSEDNPYRHRKTAQPSKLRKHLKDRA